MSTITRRRVAGASGSDNDGETSPSGANHQTSQQTHDKNSQQSPSAAEKKVAYDPRDLDESKSTPKLTLMEEVLLLGLKDKQVRLLPSGDICVDVMLYRQGYLSFWNDSISYALRGCIVMELAFRNRIAMVKDPNRRKYPLSDRYIEVINDKLTGEVLLDEALKMMKISDKMSVASWIDLMSGKNNDLFIHIQYNTVYQSCNTFCIHVSTLYSE